LIRPINLGQAHLRQEANLISLLRYNEKYDYKELFWICVRFTDISMSEIKRKSKSSRVQEVNHDHVSRI